MSGVEGRSKRASKPLHLVPLPSDHGAQRGEAYRKELKGRLRAAVPRSLRKLTFRVAGLDDPLVQLDSQKLRELEKLESWLIKHFPTEMSATPVCVPRERLRSLVERVGYASCPSGTAPACSRWVVSPARPFLCGSIGLSDVLLTRRAGGPTRPAHADFVLLCLPVCVTGPPCVRFSCVQEGQEAARVCHSEV